MKKGSKAERLAPVLVNHLQEPENPQNRVLLALAEILRTEMKKLGKIHLSPRRWGYVGELSSQSPVGEWGSPDEGTYLEDLAVDCYGKIFLVKPGYEGEEARREAQQQRAIRWQQLLHMAHIQGEKSLYFYVRKSIRNYLLDKEKGANRPAHNLFQHLRKSIHRFIEEGVLFWRSHRTITNGTQVWFAGRARPDDVRLPRAVSSERLHYELDRWDGWDERFKQLQVDPDQENLVRAASYTREMMDTLLNGGIDSFLIGDLVEALKQIGRERNLMCPPAEIREDQFLEEHPDTTPPPPEELADLEHLEQLRRQIDQLPDRVRTAIDASSFQQRKKETLHKLACAFFEVFRQTDSSPNQADVASHLQVGRQWVHNRWNDFMELLRASFDRTMDPGSPESG